MVGWDGVNLAPPEDSEHDPSGAGLRFNQSATVDP